MNMTYLQIMLDLEQIDYARAMLAKEEHQDNPLRDILEVMTDMAEKHMRPKPKPRMTWAEVWERFSSHFAATNKKEEPMSRLVTEDELIAKATGPRITKEELDANVVGYGVFNVYEALTALGIPAFDATKLLTIAVVTTKNGFNVVGESACAWPANFDADIGSRLALNDAKNKLWALMGYELKSKVALAQQIGQSENPLNRTYVGTKALFAQPMTLGDYNTYRGWTIPKNENPYREGYLVQYPDGYISWSPKEVFDVSYQEMAISHIPSQSEATTEEDGAPKTQPERSEGATTWEDRVRQEEAELSDRLAKLDLFIADDFKFLSLPDRQQRLLKEQREAMNSYRIILEARLED
jgi:hypothetical protein